MTTARLPLFPLNAVLFPGLVLPLNVFEERYRAMMRELLKTDEDEPRRFAVVAIRDGRETAPTAVGMPDTAMAPAPTERGPSDGFGPDPVQTFHRVGCIADAAKIRERADGSFEVLATGTTRVKLLSVDASGPYLTAELEELDEDSGEEAGALAEGVLRAFRSYQKRLAGASERSLTTGAELPDDPSVVSYLVAAAAVLDIPTKQRLLQAPDTATRLREELTLLRSETAVIRHLPSLPAVDLTRAPTHPN
ncbi:LON peptidase substrate-binding domain-containing protein [Streptomyces sp. NPDC002917]|uniref:LON peptidase substrate-binding domain-containing protein n=1 Tax=unclassified Streptomyces TaxID=2593676 RepID=UPI002E81D86E|nr:LON peptidase substrate-binding domain-containing protein [Streptomyces sp. NBC_00562]WTC82452.1 LON peptidase substrate-binding domain-containing protein [Streptomyces sp. NBC_01653]WTD32934.1 LON peptidase substrate-binding domain-containing protein [Streptomyces sp. NBC_01643]WTD88414.1 LON peptidase substrate-binding domain-containing protein [Streptomyces sp. NBC_01637]WUC19445.1 LON peptidase substrate-binding domain-containing protein [Streptomyces sp. NBC_00562]